MTLDDARDEIELRFCGASYDPVSQRRLDSTIVCSGALGQDGYPPPVLCATRELAVELFRRTMSDHIDDVTKGTAHRRILTWIDEPQVLKFLMTIQEVSKAHRVASARYAVYSRVIIGEAEDVPAIANIGEGSGHDGPDVADEAEGDSAGPGADRAPEPERRRAGKSRKGASKGLPDGAPEGADVIQPAEQG